MQSTKFSLKLLPHLVINNQQTKLISKFNPDNIKILFLVSLTNWTLPTKIFRITKMNLLIWLLSKQMMKPLLLMNNQTSNQTMVTKHMLSFNSKKKIQETTRLWKNTLKLLLLVNNLSSSSKPSFLTLQASFKLKLNSTTLSPFSKNTLQTSLLLLSHQSSVSSLSLLPLPKKLTKLNFLKSSTSLINSSMNSEVKKPPMLLDTIKLLMNLTSKSAILVNSSPKTNLLLHHSRPDSKPSLIDNPNLLISLEISKLWFQSSKVRSTQPTLNMLLKRHITIMSKTNWITMLMPSNKLEITSTYTLLPQSSTLTTMYTMTNSLLESIDLGVQRTLSN